MMTTSIAQPAAEIKPDNLNEYQRRALQTRKRRQAAGCYATPAQKAAFAKYMRGGADSLTQQDLEHLATNPCLTLNQRARFATLAAEMEADDYAEAMLDEEWIRRGC
jgi:hypothetical protein